MGSSASTGNDYKEKFDLKYDFTMMVHDSNFGQIKVYRKKELNFDYVMVLQKYVSPNRIQSLTSQIKALHQAFLEPEEPMALRVFNFDVLEDRWSECKVPCVRLYVEFFNFTLHDLIRRHQEFEGSFSHQQIHYIFDSVLKTYFFFKKMNQTHFMINSKAIYLSTEGCIKFSPIKAEDFFQEDNALCRAMCYETKQKDLINFERGQRYVVNEIKRLAGELLELFYRGSDGKKCLLLLSEIKKCNTLEKIRRVISQTEIDCLCLTKREKIEESTATNPTLKTQKSLSPGGEINKLSLKKHISKYSSEGSSAFH